MLLKKNTFFFLIALLLRSTLSSAQSYKPPVFTDPDRLKKIEATYPVIDKLYKEYAEQNHFPGLVYGIVVDGKLVHTGSIGYTDLEDKTELLPNLIFGSPP